ncbi:MAG TPA: carboxypeptidase-like regulatory domain-containing protein [Novosphingobium sp.]|nr:carboxypeptidase-like regulatory domain-containing protein [Novosphingobium sp.]
MRRLSKVIRPLAAVLGPALLCGAGLAPFEAQAQAQTQDGDAWQANDDDALLLDLRSGGYRVGETLRGYQTQNGVCVDLADVIQALDLPVRLDKKSRRATGWLFAEDQTFSLDRDLFTVQTVNNAVKLRPGELHDTPEGWCVELASLSRWFGVSFKPDLSNASLLLESDKPLPFLAAIERKSRAARLRPAKPFDLSFLPQAELPYRAWRAPSVDAVIKLGLRNDPQLGTVRETRYELYSTGELGGASFESRLASDVLGHPAALRLRAYRNDPSGRLLGPLKATQLAAGDVSTFAGNLTGQSAVGRGVFISNRPVARQSRFAATTLRGTLPSGWDAELYRNGQLIGFQHDRADGRYEFLDVELLFGRNAFEVVLYGPQGQIRRETSEVPVGADAVPAGKTWYWAGVVELGRDLVDLGPKLTDAHVGWRWGVGVERGIDGRTSLGIAAQSQMLGGRRHTYLEASFRRSLGPMLVELSGAHQLGPKNLGGQAFKAAAIGEIAGVSVQAETLWAFGGYESELVDAHQRREHSLRLDKSFKWGGLYVPVSLGARQSTNRDGEKVTEVLTRLGINARRLALTAELSKLHTTRRVGPPRDDDDATRVSLLTNAGRGKVRLRSETRFRLGDGFESARVVSELRLGARSDLRIAGEYRRDTRQASLGVGLVRQFDAFSVKAEGDIASDGAVGASLAFAFSFGADPLGAGMRFSNEKLALNGQAAVNVWRDDDADGRRDPGEEAIAGVIVAPGLAEAAPTDAEGHTLVTGLRPFQPVALAIDTGSLEDVFLQPASQGVVVTPRPGIAARVDLPLVPTGEAEGSLLDLNGDPIGGVGLELVDARGAVMATARSEFDGFFLFEKVPYGAYRVRPSAESATALGIAADWLGTARIDRAEPVARLGPTSLARVARVAAAP